MSKEKERGIEDAKQGKRIYENPYNASVATDEQANDWLSGWMQHFLKKDIEQWN